MREIALAKPSKYKNTEVPVLPDNASREEKRLKLLQFYYPVVTSVVGRIGRKLPHYANREDLHSAGVFGLVHAVKRYDKSDEKRFGGYVAMRVRGAVLDELRRQDPLSRNARAKARQYRDVVERLEQDLGSEPSDEDTRQKMGVSVRDFGRMKKAIEPIICVPLDEPCSATSEHSLSIAEMCADPRAIPANQEAERREMVRILNDKLYLLNERQRDLIKQYYFEGRKLVEISRDYGVSEARACQIHTRALQILRLEIQKEGAVAA